MTEQLFQIGIKAIIRNDENQILLLKNKDYWDIPGGRMDQGEDIEAALLRELNEEIGVDRVKAALECGKSGQAAIVW